MAIATANVTFTAAQTATFTWSPPLSSNPPQVIGCGVTVTDGGPDIVVNLAGAATNIGGTLNASDFFTGVVALVASD
jgi:hypothetical protein